MLHSVLGDNVTLLSAVPFAFFLSEIMTAIRDYRIAGFWSRTRAFVIEESLTKDNSNDYEDRL